MEAQWLLFQYQHTKWFLLPDVAIFTPDFADNGQIVN
jgi:hypothetical protein